MISRISIALLFLVLAFQVSAQQVPKIQFTIKNAGVSVKGTFDKFKIGKRFYPDSLNSSFFGASIETSTINTGIKGRDKHLRKAKYFDVENYPNITFKSTTIVKTTTGLLVKGDLTIKTTVLEVEVPVTIEEEEGTKWFRGYLEINRRDYGVGKGHLIMGNKVKINISIPYSEN